VKIADLTKRIDDLDESLKTLRIKGTTRIDWNCLTSEERALFGKVNQLKEEYSPFYPPDDVLAKNHGLFLKGIELIVRRAIDFFQTATRALCVVDSEDDPGFELVFNLRIYWFLYELQRHCEKMIKEEELSREYEKFEDFEREWNKYLETLEDKTPLWSKESFEHFIRPFFDARLRKKEKRR